MDYWIESNIFNSLYKCSVNQTVINTVEKLTATECEINSFGARILTALTVWNLNKRRRRPTAAVPGTNCDGKSQFES